MPRRKPPPYTPLTHIERRSLETRMARLEGRFDTLEKRQRDDHADTNKAIIALRELLGREIGNLRYEFSELLRQHQAWLSQQFDQVTRTIRFPKGPKELG